MPSRAAGMADRDRKDARVRAIAAELFGAGGRGIFLADYKIDDIEMNPGEKPWAPTKPFDEGQRKFIAALRAQIAPDFALEGGRISDGLTFLHRRHGDRDLYFVTNLQPSPSDTAVTFRVSGKSPEMWNPRTGKIAPCQEWTADAKGVRIPLRLDQWESVIVVFSPGGRAPVARRPVESAPPPLAVAGPWSAWTADEKTKFFSGTREYVTTFDLPAAYVQPGVLLTLDLGPVGCVAEVFCNGTRAGVAWMQPYHLDVTMRLHAGSNNLRVLVTNTPQNYAAGLTDLGHIPEKYTQGGALWRSRDRIAPLPMSGLPGPVQIVATHGES